MKRTVVVVLVLAVVLVGLVGASLAAAAPSSQPSPAANETPPHAVTGWEPVNFFIDGGPCGTGELILVEGTVHYASHSFPVDGGYRIHSNLQLVNTRAVGQTTGEQYVITGGLAELDNFLPTGQEVVGSVSTNLIIGRGSLPNQTAIGTYHYIVNPDGTIKVEAGQFHELCQGGTAPPTASAAPTATATPTATAKAQSRP